MRLVEPSFEILSKIDGNEILRMIEMCARTCYQSAELTSDMDATKRFVERIMKRHHESVLEHVNVSVRVICDRAIMAEFTRHRHCAFSVESSRYCKYSSDKMCGELTFIKGEITMMELMEIEKMYLKLLEVMPAEQARGILPMALKTEMIITTNLREWRHIFKLRCAVHAHPQIRELCKGMLKEFRNRIPIIFDDLDG